MSFFSKSLGDDKEQVAAFVQPPDNVIVSTDHRILCRECHSDQPMGSIVLLRSYALRDGKVISEVTGERVSCQVCGATFTIGPHGVFLQHPEALPFSPQRQLKPVANIPNISNSPAPSPDEQRGSVFGVPLKRPTV